MSINRKVIFITLGMIFIAFLAVYLISEIILQNSFLKLEKQNMMEDVNRVINVLSSKIQNLDMSVQDWANWDDTYQFATDGNENYINRNLTDENFDNAAVNLIAVIDLNKRIVYEKTYDLNEHIEIPTPPEIENYFTHNILVNHTDTSSGTAGIILLTDTPFLISARPILTSSVEGPSAGTIIFGNFMDSSLINELSNTVQSSITVLPENSTQIPTDFQTAKLSLSTQGGIFIEPIDRDNIAGYKQIYDIFGDPAFIIKVTSSRDISAQGRMAIFLIIISVLSASLLFGLVFIYIMKKTVLSRLSTVSNSVTTIGITGDISKRTRISGNDELSNLSNNINYMLDKLEQTTNELGSQKNLVDRILQFSPNIIVLMDEKANIKLVNKAFCELFQISEDEALGKPLNKFVSTEKLIETYMQFETTNDTSHNFGFRLDIGGTEKTLDVTLVTMSPTEFLLICRDVTERNEVQEKLYLNDRLASIGEMAAGIAHELNNPLTGIIMLSQSIIQGELPDDIKRDLTDINSEANRASDVVRNLLAFARKQPPSKRPTQINKIINDVLKLRQYEHSVNNIEVITKLDTNLPETMVDNIQIQQVFLNIVLNAEYSMTSTHKQGKLQVESYASEGKLIIDFTDDGSGIKEEDMKKLFQPFFTTKEVGIGTGLGLSLCYGIVNRHGGSIHARSKFGYGATFTVELPIEAPNMNGNGNGQH